MPSNHPRPISESPSPLRAAAPFARHVKGRYELIEELGRGGMAQVYRAIDLTTGRSVALKQLLSQQKKQRDHASAALFEREFHTLAQLSHPRVIEVYDYGVNETGPYYTMELLDGGDLRERSPLPWREACELIYDVCSSLALLHSRRFVHRDISPRNVRCMRDGHAKLIDFGAMVPMGSGHPVVGTAPFLAPEAVQGSQLDARTDLFSLGATFYFALTGRLAFPASDLTQLVEAWAGKQPAPSFFAADIPSALDSLVSSLINLEPALRPRSAFEVMQRLAAIANIVRVEPLSVSSGYLATPSVVGRDDALQTFRLHMQRALRGRSQHGLLFAAAPGLGRSRMLDASALEAKLLGAHVLFARALGDSPLGLATTQVLAQQLLEALPEAAPRIARERNVWQTLFVDEVGELSAPGAQAPATAVVLKTFTQTSALQQLGLQRALADWFLHVSDEHPLLLAIDDVHAIDDASIALLAVLAQRSSRHQLLVTGSVEQAALAAGGGALDLLSAQCQTVALRPLDLTETEALLSSVFGDVPNLTLLCARIDAIACGSPRECMLLLQHLVDRGSIRYDGGTWSLPEQLSSNELPATAEDAFRARLAMLQPLSRRLVEAQALALREAFSYEDYCQLAPEAQPRAIDEALAELARQQILRSAGNAYLLTQRKVAIRAQLDAATERERHRALAELHEHTGGPVLGTVRHLLLSGQREVALDRLIAALADIQDRTNLDKVTGMDRAMLGDLLERALHAAGDSARSPFDLNVLRRWVTLMSVSHEDALYWQAAPAWLEQITLDSGFRDWQQLTDVADPIQRVTQALTRASERYAAAPVALRVYAPEEALRHLVHYVVISIAIGARTLDAKLLLSLPELLEPFAPLSPVLHAIWHNALATRESAFCQTEQSCVRWIDVYERLGKVEHSVPELVASIRNAVAFGVGIGEASLGVAAAMRWAEILDRDPLQEVNAMVLRKVLRLQQGDLEGAERFRKQAELLAVQSGQRQMFTNMLTLEIRVHAAAWDLTGVTQIAARIAPLAKRYRGWEPMRHLAEGYFQCLRGDNEAARAAFEDCVALSAPDPSDPTRSIAAWPSAIAALAEMLLALGRAEEARDRAESALSLCNEHKIVASAHDISRALALAEGRLSLYEAAAPRLDRLIEEQRALGVTGLNLGMSFEARARIAIWSGDREAVERNGRLAADQYRHGHGSTLGARYERLMDEARVAGIAVLPQLSAFESTVFGTGHFNTRMTMTAMISEEMKSAGDAAARAERALNMICQARGAKAGHLYLAQAGGLVLAASTAGSAPDQATQDLIIEFWSQKIADVDTDTDMPEESAAHGSAIWTDFVGTVHQPLLISAGLDGAIVHAGAAVLIPDPTRSCSASSVQIVAELGLQLIRLGDSEGVR